MKELKIFLKYWQKRNFKKMYSVCQRTWQLNNSVGKISNLFKRQLISFEVITETSPTPAVKDCECRLTTLIDGITVSEKLRVRLVSEIAPYKPDIRGKWGVVPNSFRKTDGENRGKIS